MSLERARGILAAFEALNSGADHGCDYAIYELPPADSIEDALAGYFSSLSTSLSPRRPPEDWGIRTTPLGEYWRSIVEARVQHWFFQQEYSPRIEQSQTLIVEDTVRSMLATMASEGVEAYRVEVAPPMWYDCAWEDFAFVSNRGAWLLHLGFSD
jgi:hypothetical protein